MLLGIDVGGTNLKAGLIDIEHELVSIQKTKTQMSLAMIVYQKLLTYILINLFIGKQNNIYGSS